MKYKLIAMDFDGTLLTDSKDITPHTREVLWEYKEKGYLIVGVTARALGSAKSAIDMDMFDYLILNNGTYIYDVKNDKGTYEGIINKEDYYNLTEDIDSVSNRIDFCSASMYYYYKNKPQYQLPYTRLINKIDEINDEIVRMNIHVLEQSNIGKYCNLIRTKYKNLDCVEMHYTENEPKWLVINPKGINKGTTLEKLGKQLNITPQEMIFFGDGPNDIEVMKLVGCSVAMENALPKVKENAKYTTLSNNKDGIAVFLEKNQINQ